MGNRVDFGEAQAVRICGRQVYNMYQKRRKLYREENSKDMQKGSLETLAEHRSVRTWNTWNEILHGWGKQNKGKQNKQNKNIGKS